MSLQHKHSDLTELVIKAFYSVPQVKRKAFDNARKGNLAGPE